MKPTKWLIALSIVGLVGVVSIWMLMANMVSAPVKQVSQLNMGFMGQQADTSGTVIQSQQQIIKKPKGVKVEAILVKKGDHVSAGTPLVQFDTQSLSIELAIKKIELAKLKRPTPAVVSDPVQKVDGLWNRLTSLTQASSGQGTTEDPYVFDCDESVEISPTFVQEVMDHEATIQLGELGRLSPALVGKLATTSDEPSEPSSPDPVELGRKQLEIDELAHRLDSAKAAVASQDGIVSEVGGKKELVVVQQTGQTLVNVTLNETQLDQVGQTVYWKGYEDGQVLPLKMVSVSQEASSQADGLSQFEALFQTDQVLSNGTSGEIYFADPENQQQAIILEPSYIFRQGKKYYVYKEKQGRLVKQEVKLGQSVYGIGMTIQSGLSMKDWIAFPHIDGLHEGMKTKKEAGV